MSTIWICTLNRISLSFWPWDFVDRTTHGTLMSNGRWFDFLRCLGFVLDLWPTNFVTVTIWAFLQATRTKGQFHLSPASFLLVAGCLCLSGHVVAYSPPVFNIGGHWMWRFSPLFGQCTVIPFFSNACANMGRVSGSPWNNITCFGLHASAKLTKSVWPAWLDKSNRSSSHATSTVCP